MAVTIRGTVFDDLNNNGVLDPGEPGIPNVYVVIRDPNGVCTTVQTDASGIYNFLNLTVAGNYTVYETAVDPGATCPPTTFAQPTGFTNSTTFRTQTISVTQAQIDNNVIINGRNYGHDNPDIFNCSYFGYQTFSNPDQPGFSLVRVNLVTGQITMINPDLGVRINAIGYNILDNMIYGMEGTTTNLLRVAEDGSILNLGPIPNLPVPPITYNVGTIDDQGHMFIFQQTEGRYYVIDVNQNSPTFGQLLDPTAGYIVDTAPFGTSLVYPPTNTLNITDWSYSPIDGQLYAVQFSDSGPSTVVRINPTTGVVTQLTTTGIPGGSQYGASFMDSEGNFYAINNDTGRIYRITISGNNATGQLFSQSTPSTANDGAACIGGLIELDFGDAPDPTPGTGVNDYNTLLANNGPRHQIINQLTLGTQVTGENDAYANLTTDATGDDIPQGIQDDGVTLPLTPLLVTDTTYSLTVDVVNNTGLPANVYGWIDFNKNGVFQGNETAPVVVVPSAPGVQQVVLNFTVPVGVTLTPDHTFVRVRLTTDELINQNTSPTSEDTRSIGPASDGEVEDYYLQIDPVADISVVKTVNPDPVVAGNQAIYTITVSNAGPSDSTNVTLTDVIPACILNPEFSIDGGITFNPWVSPYVIGTMAPGATVTILIRGTVDPSCTGTITNTARVDSPTLDPNPPNNETTIVTPINPSADVSVVKTVNPDPVVAGEEATYTITVSNAGPSDALNVILTDVIPACILNPEFSIDGGATFNPWVSPYVIGTMAPGATVTILIRGTVDPSCTGTITNTAIVDSPTPDPNPPNNETTIVTPINPSADLSIVKTVNPDPVVAGEEVEYTITVSNAGPSDALNVILTDVIPACILNPEFSIDGGVTFNPWVSPYVIGTMVPGATFTILIRGTVDPSCTGTITNTARVDSPTPDPNPPNNETTIITPINPSADVSVVKTANGNKFTTGDVAIYTIAVTNAGPSDAQNVILTDLIPPEILNPEFSIDGGVTFNPWVSPYNIGTIAAGTTVTILIRGTISETAIGTVRNTAIVDSSTPDPNPTNNSSTVDIEVKIANLKVVKSVDKAVAKVGDTLTYTVSIKNTGNTAANDVVFKDQIPVGTSFVPGSVSVNGISDVGANPGAGFNIGTINPGETVLVSFAVKVEFRPTPPEVVNTAVVDYSFIVDPSRPPIEKSTTSNEVVTQIEIIQVDVLKSADKTFVVKGDTITYTVIITNSSTIPLNGVVFTDPIPEGTSFVPASVTINGNPASGNPSTGINLGTLDPGETVRVSFKVKVDFVPCPPRILNKAFVNFNYIFGNNVIEETVESNSSIIDVGPTSYKQLSREEYVKIPCQKPDAEEILNTLVDIEITDTKVIKTPMIASLEGQNLTGFKLIVEGVLNQKVEYIACDKKQSVHAAHYRVPFSTFIILPENYVEGTNVEVEAIVEDIYSKLVDKRTVFKNITFMIFAKF
ncbi:DUF11 domain-containing protein [Clostridium sporogenes]|uniref:DUF6923 family protein n=1 Tax=Clostridium sporogenes TaxID=1509 RepID=UPI0013D7E1CB|nr:GEVED domain-containing protein [Clostridium sporogenes]NFV12500.1 DUF11 domain-containing protein [Clostridium sporogenes]